MGGWEALRFFEHVHGHLGWLAAAVLFHPALLLRDLRRRAHLSVGLSVGLVTLVAAGGASIYGDYTARIKQGIFIEAPRFGWLFERKEHLAFGAVLLAWGGTLAYVAATRASGATRLPLRVAACRAFQGAFAFAFAAAVLGTIVASYRTF